MRVRGLLIFGVLSIALSMWSMSGGRARLYDSVKDKVSSLKGDDGSYSLKSAVSGVFGESNKPAKLNAVYPDDSAEEKPLAMNVFPGSASKSARSHIYDVDPDKYYTDMR